MAVTLRCGDGMRRAFKLCVMDCDGVIFDSNRLKTRAYESTLEELGVPPTRIESFVELHLSDVSISRFVKFKTFFEEMVPESERGGESPSDLVEKALQGYSRNCLKLYGQLKPVAGAMEFVKRCGLKPYVCSGGAQTELAHVFTTHGITDNFEEILGSPTTKVEHMNYIMEKTKVAPGDILFIGDGWTDFKTSMVVGAHFCFLTQMSDWQNADNQISEGLAAHPGTSITRCDTWEDLLARIVMNDEEQ